MTPNFFLTEQYWIHFLPHAPGLPLEIAFQTSAEDRQASLRKLQELKAAHGDEVVMFCTHDQREFADWTSGRGNPDLISLYGLASELPPV